jgi:DNA-binding response OmpR family regulator
MTAAANTPPPDSASRVTNRCKHEEERFAQFHPMVRIMMNTVAVPGDLLRVAVLEGDAVLRDRVLIPRLADYGFEPKGFGTTAELCAYLESEVPEILVLDVELPDQDGFLVARQMRSRYPGIGIVVLTALGETPDRIRGLREGADAYLSKPVEIQLLAATLHSLARRVLATEANQTPATRRWRVVSDGWFLVSPSGRSAGLTDSERRVFSRLIAAGGTLVTREQLIAAVTTDVYDFDPHRLDTLIYRLRKKVAVACQEALPLIAIHGEGYVLRG